MASDPVDSPDGLRRRHRSLSGGQEEDAEFQGSVGCPHSAPTQRARTVSTLEPASVEKGTFGGVDIISGLIYLTWYWTFAQVAFVVKFLAMLPMQIPNCLLKLQYKQSKVEPGDGYALVTGASSGIGTDIAKSLARRGYDLLLVARSAGKLEALAEELKAMSESRKIDVRVVCADLSEAGSPSKVYQEVQDLGLDVSILVNNAGVGTNGHFVEQPIGGIRKMMFLNNQAAVELMHCFAKDMVSKGRGHILNNASVAGMVAGCPSEAGYAATKAFMVSLSRSINYELRYTGVSVTALCPGLTATEFFKASNTSGALALRLPMMVESSESCAEKGVKAMFAGKITIVTGTSPMTNWFLSQVTFALPERISCWLAHACWAEG